MFDSVHMVAQTRLYVAKMQSYRLYTYRSAQGAAGPVDPRAGEPIYKNISVIISAVIISSSWTSGETLT